MSKYYSGFKTDINYKKELTGNNKYYSYFYYDIFNILLNKISISQIFGPYKSFSVQSASTWFKELKRLYNDIDSDAIKDILIDGGLSI